MVWQHGDMDLGLKDRAFVVSGASSGLGWASAAELLRDGASVVLCSRSQDRLEQAAARLDAGTRVRLVAGDLGDPLTTQRLIDVAGSAFGRLDGAVISVGGPPAGPVGGTDDDTWRASFETVFLGPLRLAREVLAGGSDRAVTVILSTSVRAPVPNLGISNGLRPGLAGALKTLADEYGPSGNRVNMLLPGRIDTDRITELESTAPDPAAFRAAMMTTIPLRRYGRPEELGRVAAFLTSPAASYLNGVALAVDGGLTRSW